MNELAEIHARPKIVGARIKRTEDPRLLTGRGAYTDDRQVPQGAWATTWLTVSIATAAANLPNGKRG